MLTVTQRKVEEDDDADVKKLRSGLLSVFDTVAHHLFIISPHMIRCHFN
jgi:hypothetical protein